MTYRERLAHWAVVRAVRSNSAPNFQRVVVARFRRRVDAEGHAIRLRQLMPSAEFLVLFDPQPESLTPPDQS